MKLKSGEEAVISEKAYIETVKIGEEEYKDFCQREGTLYVTTRRVVMETIVSGNEAVLFGIPIDSIRKAFTQGLFRKNLVIQADLSDMSSEVTKLDKSKLSCELGTFLIRVNAARKWAEQLSFWLPKK